MFKDLYAHFKGGVSFLFLQLKIMFFMPCSTVDALRKCLKVFEDRGLCMICGNNVTVTKREIVVICLLLIEVGAFHHETVNDILRSLRYYSMSDIVKLFDFLL